MARITRKMAEKAFEQLCKTYGKRIATAYNDVGAWRFDYYQGYNIEEISNDGGGISQPFGSRRYSSAEFYAVCWFAIDMKRYLEPNA